MRQAVIKHYDQAYAFLNQFEMFEIELSTSENSMAKIEGCSHTWNMQLSNM